MKNGYLLAAVVGVLWSLTIIVCLTIVMAFSTGLPVHPVWLAAIVQGAAVGLVALYVPSRLLGILISFALVLGVSFMQPFGISLSEKSFAQGVGVLVLVLGLSVPLSIMTKGMPAGTLTRHQFEEGIVRFLTGFGYVFFTAIVVVPFYVMLMTSVKGQQALLLNPLDFSIEWDKGWDLFRSYQELFTQYNFGSYLLTSFLVSVATVAVTLLFSVPGAYAVARLRFKGQAVMSRSILLIYMVPMIVLALPIYVGFSMFGLRNSLFGLLLIYPVTTIPVSLYMLQGYFRGLPAEIEEAGLMDGLSRLGVIWKITLPLSLPALASVSLYVFMIAWNEFLLAFMLLDDPSKFTLTRGVTMLNSSEVPRQHLMAGAVIATLPILVLFLGLERFMTKGLTAGSVKG
ncbi:carbohydrate ABC transporter membrane protein 2, CUT1 family (TC 3.A.1.1.-) [Cohaesibacter marisflavi]|uniref:Carbohydrate ABC transporter membrane protein 2, CUT1 family (TC 3.A.1.1.-) n=1 Tax=Cohaesibacter marisflavi TaxID=655353 RepID=A0A1I5HW32_9HYPH|nr:carbohydrate ABC transporter permease [Cohaesibacter marisflavi]SFO52554.1 carbohydrate ABC transporter membrane protein 2, CUT1 family (TC 3.A.1.1.-) [Cohaesibacter marisflavi]